MDLSRYLGLTLIAAAVLAVAWLALLYNGLVKWRNVVQSAWAQIDVQLKRRYDLIPNLVEAVKGYAAHEREVFEQIARTRSAALAAATPRDVAESETRLAPAMRSLFAVAEQYPQLRADQNFRSLMEELVATENKVAFARQYYNDSVRVYNTKIQQVPAVLLARGMAFGPQDYLEVDAVQREVQQVKF